MKKLWIFFLLIPGLLASQNEVDAVRYSQSSLNGSARFVALGGAMGALGGDFSATGINPAGIGVYRKSELNLGIGLNQINTLSTFEGRIVEDRDYAVNIENFGLILQFPESNSKWRGAAFGFGYNRINNFTSNYEIQGQSNGSSLLDDYTADINSLNTSNSDAIYDQYAFDAALAYDTWLINPLAEDSTMYNHVLQGHNNILQKESIRRSGGMGEYSFNLGGNYKDKLYLGMSMGIPIVRYTESTTYSEQSDDENPINDFDRYALTNSLNTTGSGVNFKVGFIYRMFNWLRVGGSVHTPSYLWLTDEWDSSIESWYDNGDYYFSESPLGNFEYRLITPARYNASAALVLRKLGLISMDITYVDYSTAHLTSSTGTLSEDYDFINENEAIRSSYQTPIEIGTGAELRLFKPLLLRAGARYYGSPYQDDLDIDESKLALSGGIGIREKHFFADLTYVTETAESQRFLYPSSSNPVDLESTSHRVILGFGVRF